MNKRKKISILIIEDNRLLREGITNVINEQKDLKVIASLSEREKSLSEIFKLKPNVVLLDIGLRSQNSLKIVKTIKDKSSEIKIIVMDLLSVESDILNFVQAGASGFILKDAITRDFMKTIRSVAAGKKVLPSNMTGSLFSQIVERALINAKSESLIEAVQMTNRERQVIELIADGKSNKEIGKILNLSVYTVKGYVHNILEKMTLRKRVQIAVYANTKKKYKDTAESISQNEK
jgi:DNA-binding NarL/FixJ family response regulator